MKYPDLFPGDDELVCVQHQSPEQAAKLQRLEKAFGAETESSWLWDSILRTEQVADYFDPEGKMPDRLRLAAQVVSAGQMDRIRSELGSLSDTNEWLELIGKAIDGTADEVRLVQERLGNVSSVIHKIGGSPRLP
jgi:hypothetical protein